MDYIGDELGLFQHAVNWKKYWSSQVRPFIAGRTLEVGAGLGGNINFLNSDLSSYTALEPDSSLATELERNLEGEATNNVVVMNGTLNNVEKSELYDTILYIDVLEHIDNDKAEFDLASSHLSKGGHLIVLCPAHQKLYSPFDSAVGHFRRHNKESFKDLAKNDPLLVEKKVFYLDSVGLFASLANKLILKESMPTKKQISLWDNVMVPVSKISDRLTFNMFGKTVIGIWQKV